MPIADLDPVDVYESPVVVQLEDGQVVHDGRAELVVTVADDRVLLSGLRKTFRQVVVLMIVVLVHLFPRDSS